MKAIVQNAYGSPDVLRLKDVDKPEVKENDVLVRVVASSVNAGDIFSMKGNPWLARFTVGFPKPKDYILGWDAAGYVESVGDQAMKSMLYAAALSPNLHLRQQTRLPSNQKTSRSSRPQLFLLPLLLP